MDAAAGLGMLIVTDASEAAIAGLLGAGLLMCTEPDTLKELTPKDNSGGGIRLYCTVYVTSAVVGSCCSCSACICAATALLLRPARL